jgi:hypothetical protein
LLSLQNWAILGIVTLAGLLLFLNVLAMVALLPQLARSFLGIEGEFARLGIRILNMTTLSVAAAITWLAIDPLLEAAYVLKICARPCEKLPQSPRSCSPWLSPSRHQPMLNQYLRRPL